MLDIKYPEIDNKNRTLEGIFTIETNPQYDTILLGDEETGIELGFVTSHKDGTFYFCSVYEVEHPYPRRSSYAEVWQDILTLIVNEFDLMVEMAILANRKVNPSHDANVVDITNYKNRKNSKETN